MGAYKRHIRNMMCRVGKGPRAALGELRARLVEILRVIDETPELYHPKEMLEEIEEVMRTARACYLKANSPKKERPKRHGIQRAAPSKTPNYDGTEPGEDRVGVIGSVATATTIKPTASHDPVAEEFQKALGAAAAGGGQ